MDHAPTELVLTRQCADVSKLLYHMRINGDILDHDLFASIDGQLRAFVSNSLCGDLPDHSWWQATTGVSVGGLGLRTAVTVALPAFVVSRILSRPLVVTMVDHLCAAFGASRQTIMAEYDARTDEALSRLASTLPTATALELLAKLDEAYAESHLSWQNVLSGSEPAMRDQPPPAPRHARVITPDDGDGDEEHPHTRKRTKIQGVITAYIDSGVREKCMRVRDPGPHARSSLSLATLMWITRGCGGSTLAMARPWMLMSTFTRSASAWAVLGPRNPSPAPPATLAFWTRARRMPPAAPWARPRVVTTPSPLSYTQPHNNATTPLRWRYLASFLARTCDLLMSSLQPWVTPTLHWTCPSALRTLWRLASTAPSPGWRPNTTVPTWLPFSAKTFPTPRSCGVPLGDLTLTG